MFASDKNKKEFRSTTHIKHDMAHCNKKIWYKKI